MESAHWAAGSNCHDKKIFRRHQGLSGDVMQIIFVGVLTEILTWNITMTSQWAWRRLKLPASRMFTQPLIQAQIKKKLQSSASLAFVQGILPVTDDFPAQMASKAENVSIWWRHHDIS